MPRLLQRAFIRLHLPGPHHGEYFTNRVSFLRVLGRSHPCQLYSQYRLNANNGRVSGAIRHFGNSPVLHKKKDKAKRNAATDADYRSPKTEPASGDDPLDLSVLDRGIANAVSRLTEDISKLSVGGRFNTEAIENLRVFPTKGSKESVKLGELAQIIPKGARMVTILVAEEEVSCGAPS